jgi:hypothetical protein
LGSIRHFSLKVALLNGGSNMFCLHWGQPIILCQTVMYQQYIDTVFFSCCKGTFLLCVHGMYTANWQLEVFLAAV